LRILVASQRAGGDMTKGYTMKVIVEIVGTSN